MLNPNPSIPGAAAAACALMPPYLASGAASSSAMQIPQPASQAMGENELDEEAQLEAEICACADNTLNVFSLAFLDEVLENRKDLKITHERRAPYYEHGLEGRMIVTFLDTINLKEEAFKCPIDLDRFIGRYIFNMSERYLSKLDDDSADSFADACLRIVEKIKESERKHLTDFSDALAKTLSEKLGAQDIGYKCFAAEILSHPRGGAYQGTPLENSRVITEFFANAPLIKREMESIWPANILPPSSANSETAEKLNGHGTRVYPSGNVYEGEFKDDQRDGTGAIIFTDGSIYNGQWKNDKINGRGQFMFHNGNVYKGELKDGHRHGHGQFIFGRGGSYEGEWKEDKMHGRGKLIYTHGGLYEGEFKDGNKHGRGTHTNSDGDVYTGEWNHDCKHGRGTFTGDNGAVYVGEWKDDKCHGQGKCTYPDGDIYEGEWKDDKSHGRGKFTLAKGGSYAGTWKDGNYEG